MCGIFGYVGARNAIDIVIEGLRRLEYRGYDSAGLAGVQENQIVFSKEVGKISVLEREVRKQTFQVPAAIAQTRWATHGKATQVNAHPHFDKERSLALVHNGIIENHDDLRRGLKDQGVSFVSETDTEVVAHLIAYHYDGDLLGAIQQAVAQLKGAYAVALVHRDFPDQIIAIAHEAPLVIGIGNHEAFLSSDPRAFAFYTRQAIYLSNSEIAIIKAETQHVYSTHASIDKEYCLLEQEFGEPSKGEFEHYTLKEIYEQPQTIRNALASRFVVEYGTAIFEELTFEDRDLLSVERVLILACGTSWHAGCIAAYMLGELAHISAQVEISSEFRYKNPLIPPGTLVIAISQSGETADTIAAIREVKAKGARVLGVCNVQGSTLVREADETLFLKAGPEIGVCSTKAFTSQVVVLSLFTLLMARRKYVDYESFFFLGRRYMYPTCLEGALKLKEMSYINANGYAAGEVKHGPLALIGEQCPVVALCADRITYGKLLGNLMEIKARHGKILAIASQKDRHLEEIVDDVIYVPVSRDELAVIPVTVVTQLLAYNIAQLRGMDIDHPRHLAKSVTVE